MRIRSLMIGAGGLLLFLLVSALALRAPPRWDALLDRTREAAAASTTGVQTFVSSLVGKAPEYDDHERVHLRVPDHTPLLVPARVRTAAQAPAGAVEAHAYQYVSRVFKAPAKKPFPIGYVRRGTVLSALSRVVGPGCRGTWYAVAPRGVICDRDGFALGRAPATLVEQRLPDVSRALPFRYGKVNDPEALRFFRLPLPAEEAAIADARSAGTALPELVEQRLDGVRLLALDTREHIDARVFMRTVRGRYVRRHEIDDKPEPQMRGVLLRGERRLPYAFVYQAQRSPVSVYRLREEGLSIAGLAEHHARLRVLREVEREGRKFVVGPGELALARRRVRVARKIARPSDIPRHHKWIHVDLDEQVLVAYEGDEPVFATLVSSGKGEKHATPTGLYRIHEKHITTTMSGPDPDHGVYEVEEVPWTLFYQDSYALHGAYWHDDFGEARSHGCTNIAPVDARWLFYWSDGVLPAGWHALRGIPGSYVYISRSAPT